MEIRQISKVKTLSYAATDFDGRGPNFFYLTVNSLELTAIYVCVRYLVFTVTL